jgi:hypothetical protein
VSIRGITMNKKISIAIAFIAIIAISSIAMVNAMPIMNKHDNNGNGRGGLVERSFIRINGQITQWGTLAASGAIQTQARAALFNDSSGNQLAMSTAVWTTNTSRPISAVRTAQNFTYVFYSARLANASVSSLSANATAKDDYVLIGTWNVYTTTSTITVNTNDAGNITRVNRNSSTTAQKLNGTLSVTDNWTKFTLQIDTLDALTGNVYRSAQRQVQFNPFKVTDDSVTNAINKADISAILHNYGAMPGWGSYDVRMDFCNHYKIDITNLATVAANI